MSTNESFDRNGWLTCIGVFVAMTVDGMDLQMLAVGLPSIARELGVSPVMAGALSTYTFVGMGIGGVLAGWLSDRVGRVRVVWWSVLAFTLCTTAIGFSRGYWEVAALRFASGFGIAGLYSIGTLVSTEYAPTRIRTTVLGVLQAGWSLGYVIAALMASYLLPRFGWRQMFLGAAVPGVAALVLLARVPDPPSWIDAQKRRTLEPPVNAFALIWKNASSRRMVLLWTATTIALQFGYYGANSWLPSYLVSDLGLNLQAMGWYVAATYAMMIVGKIVTGYLADIYGRKRLWVSSCLLTAVYLPTAVYYATADNVAYVLLVFGLLYGAPYAVSATYMSESFPAGIRGTAVGTSYNVGRIGAMLSPLLIGVAATNYSIGLGIGLLGVAYAVCGFIPALFIGEKMFDPKAALSQAPAGSRPATSAHGTSTAALTAGHADLNVGR